MRCDRVIRAIVNSVCLLNQEHPRNVSKLERVRSPNSMLRGVSRYCLGARSLAVRKAFPEGVGNLSRVAPQSPI